MRCALRTFHVNDTYSVGPPFTESLRRIASTKVSRTARLEREAQPNAIRRHENKDSVVTRSRTSTAAVFSTDIDEDYAKSLENRANWYDAKWCAIDQPEWNTATWLRSEQVAPDTKLVSIEVEVSRERIALLNSYKRIGQRASIRVNNGIEYQIKPASAPFSEELNYEPLVIVRGDLSAEEVKEVTEPTSVKAPLELLVTEESCPDLYQIEDETPIEVGPFRGEGLRLREFAIAVYRYPTVVMFVEGEGIATARALIESSPHVPNLCIPYRESVRLYYKAPNSESFIFEELFEEWKEMGCEVHTTTDSFQDAFDDDDTLVYEPFTTLALVLTGGDEETEKRALEVCKEAEITAIIRESEEERKTEYIRCGVYQLSRESR